MSQPTTTTTFHGPRIELPLHGLNVDFDDLARRDPDWAALSQSAKRAKWLDFQDPKVVRQLTKSILKCDFNLSLELPDDRLCPPVPVRWNYIRWIQSLLDTTNDEYSEHYDPDRQVIGLDIGTGASAIYALLGCSTRANWRIAGTDIDEHSLTYARKNIDANNLDKQIRLFPSTSSAPLIPLETLRIPELDFVMTNPPFYDSQADMEASYRGKDASASAISFASENETICPGGDLGFVTRILDESLALRERVQWYSAMLGKMSSLQTLVPKLREYGIDNFAVTNLQAGHKTTRWALAWSFGSLRPRNDVAASGELVYAVRPWPTAQTIAVPLMSAKWAGEKVNETLAALRDVKWKWKPLLRAGSLETRQNVWSRAARRREHFRRNTTAGGDEGEGQQEKEEEEEWEEESIALAVKVTCKEAGEEVEVRWLRGHDRILFTSFCGMLKTALSNTGRVR